LIEGAKSARHKEHAHNQSILEAFSNAEMISKSRIVYPHTRL